MRRSIGVLTVSAVMALCLVSAGPAVAASKTVCGSGCAFTSIQAAIEAATPGATITIGAGSYTENLVVDKSVTLQGSGVHTVIYPAVSNPVCSPGSLCEGNASSIILVQANNVTITKVKLEGDNPTLTSGVVRGGKDIDARNGIITNHAAGNVQQPDGLEGRDRGHLPARRLRVLGRRRSTSTTTRSKTSRAKKLRSRCSTSKEPG